VSGSVVSRRYAKALIDLAVEQEIVDPVRESFRKTVGAVTENRKIRHFFFNPVNKIEDKRKLLERVMEEMEISGLLKNFLLLLLKKDRFPMMGEIYREYVHLADLLNHRAKAEVTTAVSLDRGDLKRLKARLETLTGKNVYLKVRQDPSLIAGIITKIGSVVYDGSVKSRIAKLKDQIVKG